MEIEYGFQPYSKNGSFRLGLRLQEYLSSRQPFYDKVWFASFSVKRNVIIRLLPAIKESIAAGTEMHFVAGVDHNATSYEALQELLGIKADVRIVKDGTAGRTFHPKIYLFEATNKRADLIIGSSNLTAGGMYTNYEANIHFGFDLTKKEDIEEYQTHWHELETVLNPSGPIVRQLTPVFLEELKAQGYIQHELGLQMRKQGSPKNDITAKTMTSKRTPLFGTTTPPRLPPIPAEYQKKLLIESKKKPKEVRTIVELNAFYLQLNKLQGSTIPGEVRIPKAARNLDESFWGWPGEYSIQYRQHGAARRKYAERMTTWKIVDADNPSKWVLDNVRLYDYEDRGEFRFYSNKLVEIGANAMDIIKIAPSEEPDADFVCMLVRQSSPKYAEWLEHCKNPINNSTRKFGFA